jgi:hypothetical protein
VPHKDPKARKAYSLQNQARANELRRIRYHKDPAYKARKLEEAFARRMRRDYGISASEYLALFERQKGACALCEEVVSHRRLCVDHDHQTGRVRGLLCIQCNSALGTFGDTADGLKKAIEYLEGPPLSETHWLDELARRADPVLDDLI